MVIFDCGLCLLASGVTGLSNRSAHPMVAYYAVCLD